MPHDYDLGLDSMLTALQSVDDASIVRRRKSRDDR